jgi:F420-non-reducing hydrogenase small subunit
MEKPKVAFYWCASCGGCEEAVVDLGEEILNVVDLVDIVFWPVALDFKVDDLLNLKDGEITAAFINGAVRTSEQHEMVKLLRRKSKFVIAYGSCSCFGGIPGLANLFSANEIVGRVYLETPSTINPDNVMPGRGDKFDGSVVSLPKFYDRVKSLDQVIEVDYYLPGCPPPVKLTLEAIKTLLSDMLPEKGSVLAPDVALCNECPRKETKPDKIELRAINRPHQVYIDAEKCLLAQGLLCLGIGTRAGCGAACINGNMPCTGCMGPPGNVKDQGAKLISAFASIVSSNNEEEIKRILEQIPDPTGTFYRYFLPYSILQGKIKREIENESLENYD